jgi:hypothetical protein
MPTIVGKERHYTEALGDCASEAIHGKNRERIKHPREPGTRLKFIMRVVAVVPLSPLAADQWERHIH